MSNFINHHLVKAIADMAIFLEFTSEKLLDADTSIEAMEQLAMELQLMEDEDRGCLARQLKKLSVEYGETQKAQFVDNLSELLGLEVDQGKAMSIVATLGGYVVDADGVRHQLPLLQNPSNSVIENVIKKASCACEGAVNLRRKPTLEIGPDKLTLYVDSGNLLLMLGVNEEDGDYSVRTLTNESMPNELMVIMGEKYPARAVTRDIGLVCAAFNEFVRIGDVPLMR